MAVKIIIALYAPVIIWCIIAEIRACAYRKKRGFSRWHVRMNGKIEDPTEDYIREEYFK